MAPQIPPHPVELSPKGMRAYALYFLACYAPLFLLAFGVLIAFDSAAASRVCLAGSWGYALFRLALRFHAGENRIPTAHEANVLAVRAAVYTAVLATGARIILDAAGLLPIVTSSGEPLSYWLFGLLLPLEFVTNFITLRVFLLQRLQDFLFTQRRDKNS